MSSPDETDPEKCTEFGPDQLGWMRDVASAAANPWLFVGVPSTMVPLWTRRSTRTHHSRSERSS